MWFLLLLALIIIVLLITGSVVLAVAANVLWFLLIGLVVGLLGRLIVPGAQPLGMLATTLIGIAGSLIGGILASEVFDFGDLGSFVTSVLVAALLVALGAGASGASRNRVR
jgi:uncharacterized membrane protein YeaQ/YmgE (transglycosylase-associated protein family)